MPHHLTVHGAKRKLMIAALRYYDTFAKQDGAWLFAECKLYVDSGIHVERGPGFAFRAFGTSVGSNTPVDEGLAVAEHLDDHQWFAVHGLFGDPANGRGNDWRGLARPDSDTGSLERRRSNASATTILGGARTTQVSFPFRSGSPAGPDQTPGALERSAVIHFVDRHITISIFRSSIRLRLATEKAVWSERTCNSVQSYSIV
jgi:hypothetical protein